MPKTKTQKKETQQEELAKQYQKYTHVEHVLKLPDTYVGSVETHEEKIPVYVDDVGPEGEARIIEKDISYVPALYKIYDEILVNALDQDTRLKQDAEQIRGKKKKPALVTKIDINIDMESGRISVCNDGEGIPIVMMEEHNMYPPELIFGCLLTSSNYDENAKKVTGGKNGYGAKLANIFSTEFIVETVDTKQKLKYRQIFRKNMSEKEEPVITSYTGDSYTTIEFIPDFKRLGMEHLEEDIYFLMKKRAWDVAAWVGETVVVSFNGEPILINNFKDYASMYIGDLKEVAYERCNRYWEVMATYNADEKFEQVSFVNGINTIRGGKHVDYIVDQIKNGLVEWIKKNHKKTVKPIYVRNQLMVFVKCSIVNPSFDGQTKETLTTSKTKFGSTCTISTKFINTLASTGIIERIMMQAEYKNNNEMKKSDGRKMSTIRNIPKLTDANKAGGRYSKKCTLILTEGDSAKSMAIAGLSQEGRDWYGVFPLRGKVLNVKDVDIQKIAKNKEVTDLKKILALKNGEDYSKEFAVWPLRYGNIMIMTDQDTDGSHIKGLIMNLFHTFWPELLERGFITSLITPIVKVTKGKKVISFYTLTDYENWKKKTRGGAGWRIKYYKGLGTSTSKEAKEYFESDNLKQVSYDWTPTQSANSLDLAFNKKRANDRKSWLKTYNRDSILDSNEMNVSFEDFIHKEFKHFSNYDNVRSLPSLVDGLKPSQRKVMYGCFKRNLVREIKVSQLAGYISEHSAYHHGETSLQGTIVNLAQIFVGSNNINLLSPNGQFGTRIQGGKDSASPRYIFTELSPMAKQLFNDKDFPLLNYLDDDGTSIEPEYYVPILPLILINGTHGIGTGYSTNVPTFNPVDIIKLMECKLKGQPYPEIKPWFNGFKGKVVQVNEKQYFTRGVYKKKSSNMIHITELPIGMWTEDYKHYLESLLMDSKGNNKKNQILMDYRDNSTEDVVDFTLKFHPVTLMRIMKQKAKDGIHPIEKLLKLTSTKCSNLTNMHLFNSKGSIQKYNSVYEIVDEFFDLRMDYYIRRKKYMLNRLNKELALISYKEKFIREILNDTLDLRKKKKAVIEEILKQKGYPKLNNNIDSSTVSYDYLIKMPLDTLTEEKIIELEKRLGEKQIEHDELFVKTEQKLWVDDLRELYAKFKKVYKIKKSPVKKSVGGAAKKPKSSPKANTNVKKVPAKPNVPATPNTVKNGGGGSK
jgi:DNA topoisomerase II